MVLQLLLWAKAGTCLLKSLGLPLYQQAWLSCVLALEPISLYFHFSLQSESLFLSFSVLWLAELLNYERCRKREPLLKSGTWLGLALGTRFAALLYIPFFIYQLFLSQTQQKLSVRFIACLPFGCMIGITTTLHYYNHQAGYLNHTGWLLWNNVAALYQPQDCSGDEFCLFLNQIPAQALQHYPTRYQSTQDAQARFAQAKHISENIAFQHTNVTLQKVAYNILARAPLQAVIQYYTENLTRFWHDNYLDYRNRPTPHIWNELDAEIFRLYHYPYKAQQTNFIWQNANFLNHYVRLVSGLCFLLLWFNIPTKRTTRIGWFCFYLLVIWLLGPVPYKTRFFGIYFPIMWVFICITIDNFSKKIKYERLRL